VHTAYASSPDISIRKLRCAGGRCVMGGL
jgi:hypothetical protein